MKLEDLGSSENQILRIINMDEFIKELIELCEKYKVKYDNLLPVETQYIKTEELCDTSVPSISSTASRPIIYNKFLLKAHTLKATFKKIERKPI